MLNALALSAPQQIAGPAVHHFVLPKFAGSLNKTARIEAIQEPWIDLDSSRKNEEETTSLQSTLVNALLNVVTLIMNYMPPFSPPLPPMQNQTVFFNASAINPSSSETSQNSHDTIDKRGKYRCRYGFQGRHCEQCGSVAVSPNTKIVGGTEANPHSWPAAALITFSYKADVYLRDQGVYYTVDEQTLCGGSLISRDTSKGGLCIFNHSPLKHKRTLRSTLG